MLVSLIADELLLRRTDRWSATHGACSAQMLVHKELLSLRLALSTRAKHLCHTCAQPAGPAVPGGLLLLLLLILHAALAAVAIIGTALSDLLDQAIVVSSWAASWIDTLMDCRGLRSSKVTGSFLLGCEGPCRHRVKESATSLNLLLLLLLLIKL